MSRHGEANPPGTRDTGDLADAGERVCGRDDVCSWGDCLGFVLDEDEDLRAIFAMEPIVERRTWFGRFRTLL